MRSSPESIAGTLQTRGVHIPDRPSTTPAQFAGLLSRYAGLGAVPGRADARRCRALPRFVAVLLAELKARSRFSRPDQFVFATRTGEAIRHRNLSRELRAAQTRAVDAKGRPIFPLLHIEDENGDRWGGSGRFAGKRGRPQ